MLPELLKVFGQTRNIKWLMQELGFSHHPKMIESRPSANTTLSWQVLQELAYRQDPDVMYGNLDKQQAYHEKRQKGAKRKADVVLAQRNAKAKKTAGEHIKLRLAMEHLRQRLNNTTIYGFPTDALSLVPTSQALAGNHTQWDGDGLPDGTTRIYARLLDSAAGKKKAQKLPYASRASSLADGDASITLHSLLPGSTADSPLLDLEAMQIGTHDMARSFLIRDFQCDFNTLCSTASQWDISTTLNYFFKHVDIDSGLNRTICNTLIEGRALPDLDTYMHAPLAWKPALFSLVREGYVELIHEPEPRLDCKLTPLAMQNLGYGEVLDEERRIFDCRANLALEDFTTLGCVLALEDDGFTWAPLPPVRQRNT